jgi:hypothetical protein
MPVEHFIGRLSEEFGGRLPSEIVRELERVPVGFLEQIVEYRAYAYAKAQNDADESGKGWTSTPMRTLAQEIEMELAAQVAEAHNGHG